MTRDTLPRDFFERLTEKQEILLKILLEADDEWIRGVEIRQIMRDEYDMDVPRSTGATTGIISGFTRKYDREFRDNVVAGRWVDESRQHAEHKIGEKYKEQIRDRLG